MTPRRARSWAALSAVVALAGSSLACSGGEPTSAATTDSAELADGMVFAEVLANTDSDVADPWARLYRSPGVRLTGYEEKEYDAFHRSDLRPGLRPYAIVRVRPADAEGFFEYLADPRGKNPFGRLFLEAAQLQVLPDLVPVSVTPSPAGTTGPRRDKIAVLLEDFYPTLFLLEGSRVVMSAPAVIGGSWSRPTTPLGDQRLAELHPSIQMTGHPGVGFVAFFDHLEGGRFVRGDGYALHNSPWWDWAPHAYAPPSSPGVGAACSQSDPCTDGLTCMGARAGSAGECMYISQYGTTLENARAGMVGQGYGSHGCVNLPDERWLRPRIGGREVSVAEFAFRWVGTNVPYDLATGQGVTAPGSEGYASGESTVRFLVVRRIADLATYDAPWGQASWTEVMRSVTSARESGWILPEVP